MAGRRVTAALACAAAAVCAAMDGSSTVAPVMTSPAEMAAPSAPSTTPAFNFMANGLIDLDAREVPTGTVRESDEAWQARLPLQGRRRCLSLIEAPHCQEAPRRWLPELGPFISATIRPIRRFAAWSLNECPSRP
jgi:hypothetical protein